jgi:asparagine synthase (glutamine-hydrolysing)
MCGITGFLTFDQHFDKEDLSGMTSCLSHRGPDSEGFFYDEYCGLGHKRLSVIDLSDRAIQPMHSASDRYVIVYNGEVYNYSEIGARIKGASNQSVNLKTSSDTEVILEAFSIYGIDFVNQLNGMFAIAIYDKLQQELYLFRDRLGIKPLVYFWDGRHFAFASEIKSFKQLSKIPKEINTPVIHDYLHLGFIPTPQSIYKNIYKLNAGSWMKVSVSGIEEHRYWNLNTRLQNQVITDKEEVMVKLSDLLTSSVQYQLKSDVPFGVFLSGGIDSSLITAQAVQLSSIKINTFSIGFEENSHNESEYAKAVAQYLQTNHNEFIVSYKDAMQLIDSIVETYDEPFADPSSIPTMLVSKLARQYVTVTLSGEGGDELFFGYGAYRWAKRLSHPLVKLFGNQLAAIFAAGSSRYQRISHMFRPGDSVNLRSHIYSQEQYNYTTKEIRELLTDPDSVYSFISNDEKIKFNSVIGELRTEGNFGINHRTLTPMEQQAIFDLYYYLPDDLLTKVDRASMKFSLETRVPYLDHRLVEFALNISPDLKFRDGISKYILKKVLYQYIPKKLFDRPKQGFAIPLNKWLRKELHYLIEENLDKKIIDHYGYVKYEEVDRLLKGFYAGKDYLYNRIWLLIILHKWLRRNC